MKITIFCIALAAVPFVLGTPGDAMRKFQLKPPYGRKERLSGGPDDFLPLPFAYQVSVEDISLGTPFHICSGSIISEDWVLTAAYCVVFEASFPDIFQIVAGYQCTNTIDDSVQTVAVAQVIIHEDFSFTSANNVALLKLASPLSFNDFVQPIPLPQLNQEPSGSCNIFGGTVFIAPYTDCSGILRAGETTDDCLICAKVIPGDMNRCESYSGSPLVCSDDEGYNYLAGIRDSHHGSAESPILYNEVSCFAGWINQHIAP